MTKKPDSVYYAERLAAELAAVEAATSDAARRAHRALAEQYQQILAAFDPTERGGPSTISRSAAE
jgi:hypothetical protein